MKKFPFLCILLTFTGFSPAFAQKAKQEQIYKCAGVGDAAPKYQTTKCEGDPDSMPLVPTPLPTSREVAAHTRGMEICRSALKTELPRLSMARFELLTLRRIFVGAKSEIEIGEKTVKTMSYAVTIHRQGQTRGILEDLNMVCHTTVDGSRFLALYYV